MITFFVAGFPVPQGSLQPYVSANGRPGLRNQNDFGLRQWRTQIKNGAIAEMAAQGRATFAASVYLGLTFYFAPGVPIFGQRRYDLDKLVRAVMDALTDAQAYKDDSQVTELLAKKTVYAPDGRAGVAICLDRAPGLAELPEYLAAPA